MFQQIPGSVALKPGEKTTTDAFVIVDADSIGTHQIIEHNGVSYCVKKLPPQSGEWTSFWRDHPYLEARIEIPPGDAQNTSDGIEINVLPQYANTHHIVEMNGVSYCLPIDGEV